MIGTLQDRFWAKVRQDEHGCWLWTGSRNSRGYGLIGVGNGKSRLAHRIAWTELRTKIPDHLQVDHLCAVKACVNPWHMELVTSRVNNERRWSAEGYCPLPPDVSTPWRRPVSRDERLHAERVAARHREHQRRVARNDGLTDLFHAGEMSFADWLSGIFAA